MLSILSVTRLITTVLLLAVAGSAFADIAPEEFAVDYAFVDAEISPDGQLLAAAVVKDGTRQLAVFRTKDRKPVGGVRFYGRQEVGTFYWIGSERLVIKVLERVPGREAPAYFGELYAVDYDGSNRKLLYGIRAGEMQTGSRIPKKDTIYGWADIVSILPEDPNHILISSTPMSEGGERRATLHKLNVYNGRMSTSLTRAPVSYETFVADRLGNVKLVVGTDADNRTRIYSYERDDWQEISADFGENFTPLTLNEKGNVLFYLDDQHQDKRGLFTLDLTTGEKQSVYTDKDADVTSVSFSADGNQIYALRVDPDYPTYVMLNNASEEATLYRRFLHSFPGYKVDITSHSDDGRWWLVYASNDLSAGIYYLYDKQADQFAALFGNLLNLDQSKLSQSEPVQFKASDGLTIHGYLTYPEQAQEDDKLPLVVLVHGGPHGARDYWEFDREVQMLAAQGYAILRVNYRGSGGYGRAFRKAGYRNWGGQMLSDIAEGTEWTIAQGRIDASKVCIMGGSFGGYAATQSAILRPDLYRCAISNAGVYDLEQMFNDGDIPDRLYGKSFLTEVLGEDTAQMRSFSPLWNVDKLKVPVLIAHGEEDVRVPVTQAESFRDKLDKAGKPYRWFVVDGEYHGFVNEQNRAEYYQQVTDFLGQYLH